MRDFFDKFKTQVPDLTDLVAVAVTASMCLKMIYDIINGAYTIVAFGVNNKLISILIIIGFFIFFILIKRIISAGINIIINKLFQNPTPITEENISRNKDVGQFASTASSYVNLSASLLTLVAAFKTFFKSADKDTAIVQDIGGYFQYVKHFTLSDKKEWFNSIITDYKMNIDDPFWTSITKEIPWDLINNKIQLLNFLENKIRVFKEQKVAELVQKQQELQEHIDNANSITNKILTIIDSLIKNTLLFIYNHPYLCGTIIVVIATLIWFLMMHKKDLFSEGFAKTGEALAKITDYTDKIKDSFTERMQQLYNYQSEIKESTKTLAKNLNLAVNELIEQRNVLDAQQNCITNLELEIVHLKEELNALSALYQETARMTLATTTQVEDLITEIIKEGVNNQ